MCPHIDTSRTRYARTCAREVFLDGNAAVPTRATQELIEGMQIFLQSRKGDFDLEMKDGVQDVVLWLKALADDQGFLNDHSLSLYIERLTDSFEGIRDRTGLQTRLIQGFVEFYISNTHG